MFAAFVLDVPRGPSYTIMNLGRRRGFVVLVDGRKTAMRHPDFEVAKSMLYQHRRRVVQAKIQEAHRVD